MDDQQRYRLADTLNHHTYPQRVAILELCLIDNQYMRDIAQAHLELMRRRRWLIERSNIQYVHISIYQSFPAPYFALV